MGYTNLKIAIEEFQKSSNSDNFFKSNPNNQLATEKVVSSSKQKNKNNNSSKRKNNFLKENASTDKLKWKKLFNSKYFYCPSAVQKIINENGDLNNKDLIDGEMLCIKLKEYGLGLKTELIEKVEISEDWFRKI